MLKRIGGDLATLYADTLHTGNLEKGLIIPSAAIPPITQAFEKTRPGILALATPTYGLHLGVLFIQDETDQAANHSDNIILVRNKPQYIAPLEELSHLPP